MAFDQVQNISLGRGADYGIRVNTNDPVNAVLMIAVLATAGLEADAIFKDADTFAAIVAGTTNEVTNAGYARKILDQAGGVTVTVDDTGDKVDVDFPDQTWTGVAAGDGWSRITVNYDSDSTLGTDANIVPHTSHGFVIVPDSSDITAQVAATGYFRAS